MSMRDEITNELLGAYVDGEVSSADAERIERAAQTDHDLRKQISAIRSVNKQTNSAITALAAETGKDPLAKLIEQRTTVERTWRTRLFWPVPITAGVLLGLLLAFNLHTGKSEAVWHHEVAAFHDLYSELGSSIPMALDITEQSKLLATAKTLLGEQVAIPKFDGSGYSFHGARVKANSNGTVLLVLFKKSPIHWITLGIRKRTENGLGEHEYAAWENVHYQYSLHVGGSDEEMAFVFKKAQQQTAL